MSIEKKMLVSEIQIVYVPKVKPSERPVVKNSKDCYALLMETWDKDQIYIREEFKLLALNNASRVIGIYPLSVGGLDSTITDTRLIFSVALGVLATLIILAHNHPSGGIQPSKRDEDTTKTIKNAGEIINIRVLDHLIVTPDAYYSFADNGMI